MPEPPPGAASADQLAHSSQHPGRGGQHNPAHENHEVSRIGVCCCGSHDKRMCHEERDNPVAADQGRRLIIEWTANL